MAIAGYELGSGCGPYWIAWFINMGFFGMGLVCCPRDLFDAYVRGRRATSVYRRPDRAALRAMSVEDVWRSVGVMAVSPSAEPGDWIGFLAWSVACSILLLAAPLVALTLIL
jgi:hypothetical protein